MATVEAGDNVEFEVTYKTQRPVELADLGSSFRALGRQYEEYVTRHGFDPMERNAKLYVSQVRTGSIIVRLMNMLEQGSMVLKDLDVLAGFITNLHDLIEYF